MNERLETLAAYAQGIIDATQDLPEQYAVKIEELVSTIMSVAAMADGVHTKTVDASNLVEGRNDLGDGVIAYKTGNEIRLAKE